MLAHNYGDLKVPRHHISLQNSQLHTSQFMLFLEIISFSLHPETSGAQCLFFSFFLQMLALPLLQWTLLSLGSEINYFIDALPWHSIGF